MPPTALAIEDLGIAQGILPVGLEDDGTMEVPDVSDIGWYLHGATPGRPGATVIVAHVWWHKTAGPFHRLGTLEPGARIEVGGDDGAIYDYTVVKRTMYDKDSLPGDLWRNSGPETLVLITCGGEFNSATRRYKQNIVVYAVPTQEIADRHEMM
jgi:sortase (surface protein transpeptidase)